MGGAANYYLTTHLGLPTCVANCGSAQVLSAQWGSLRKETLTPISSPESTRGRAGVLQASRVLLFPRLCREREREKERLWGSLFKNRSGEPRERSFTSQDRAKPGNECRLGGPSTERCHGFSHCLTVAEVLEWTLPCLPLGCLNFPDGGVEREY